MTAFPPRRRPKREIAAYVEGALFALKLVDENGIERACQLVDKMLEVRGPLGRVDGLTEDEGATMDHLVAAVQAFNHCDRQHPDEMRDFVDGIHRCQDALAVRIARRAFPEGWPTHAQEEADHVE